MITSVKHGAACTTDTVYEQYTPGHFWHLHIFLRAGPLAIVNIEVVLIYT